MQKQSHISSVKGKEENGSSQEFMIDSVVEDSISNESDSRIKLKEKRAALKKKIHQINKNKNHGDWEKSEEQKFVLFMKKNRYQFESEKLRRHHKVFKNMATFLKTRSSVQCRSHHQKLLARLKTFDEIVNYLENKISWPMEGLDFQKAIKFEDHSQLSRQKYKKMADNQKPRIQKTQGFEFIIKKQERRQKKQEKRTKLQQTWKQESIIGKNDQDQWIIVQNNEDHKINTILILIKSQFFAHLQVEL